jgi:hypothetical protein
VTTVAVGPLLKLDSCSSRWSLDAALVCLTFTLVELGPQAPASAECSAFLKNMFLAKSIYQVAHKL